MIKKLLAIKLRSSILAAFSGKNKKGNVNGASPSRIALMLALFILLGACFLMLFSSMAITLAAAFVPGGYGGLYFGIFMLIIASVIFIFSIFETKTELFECKDNELLQSLPIKPRDIVISRIAAVLVYNYILEALIALPATCCYLIFGGTPLAILGALIVFILLPMFATALASGVGYLVALIGKRVKNKTFITLFLSVAFLVLYFVGYGYLMNGMDAFIEGLVENAQNINESLSFVVFMGEAALLSPLSLLCYTAMTVGVSLLAYILISSSYTDIITATEVTRRGAYKKRNEKQHGAVFALVRKELSKLVSSATYMLNACMGIILSLILAGALLFTSGTVIESIDEMLGEAGITASADVISSVLICVVVLASSMNMISASALSLEGSSLWILKSMPISSSDVLIAKSLPHVIVCAPVSVVVSLVCAAAVRAPWYYYPLYILTPVCATVMLALFGTLMNVAFPKFNYDSETQVIKQSMPVFLAMLVPMLFMLLVTAAIFAASIAGLGLFASWMLFVLMAALSLAMYFILVGPASKKLDSINV